MARDVVDQVLEAGADAVRALFAAQAERIAALEAEVEELKRLLGRNSSNSSMAPSRDLAGGARAAIEEALVGKEAGRAARSSGPAPADGR